MADVIRINTADFCLSKKQIEKHTDLVIMNRIITLLDGFACFKETYEDVVVVATVKNKAAGHSRHNNTHNAHNAYNAQKQQHHPKKDVFNLEIMPRAPKLVPLLNKLNESNYDKILAQIKMVDAIDVTSILNKAFEEHSYIRIHARLIRDLISSNHIDAESVKDAFEAASANVVEIVHGHDASARLHCDYNEFCKGNKLIARATGVNLFIISDIFSNVSKHQKLSKYDSPGDYLTGFLLTMDLNDVSSKLIQDFFVTFTSGPLRYALEKFYMENSATLALSKKTTFAIESCIRPRSLGRPDVILKNI